MRTQLLAALALTLLSRQHGKRVDGGDPAVSPDGARILYVSERSGKSQLFVMNADGTGARQLTTDTAGAYSGRWSPDGKQIVYATTSTTGEQIVVVRSDGQERRVVIETRGAQSPTWLQGDRILFTAGVFPNLHIQSIEATGTNRRAVMTDSGFIYDAAASPDGRTIAFVRGMPFQGVRIYLMNADGSNQHRLATGLDNEEQPAWSPDGKLLAFQASTRRTGDSTQAYIIVADIAAGTTRRLGTHDKVQLDETPSWFPDGTQLAIQSDRDGSWSVYVIDLAGTTLAQLTRP